MIRYIQNINFQQILQTTTWFWFYINDRTLKVTTLRILYSKLWDMVNREHYEYYQQRHSIKSLTLLQKCLGLYQVYSKSNTNECLVQLSTYKVSKNFYLEPCQIPKLDFYEKIFKVLNHQLFLLKTQFQMYDRFLNTLLLLNGKHQPRQYFYWKVIILKTRGLISYYLKNKTTNIINKLPIVPG